MSSDEEEAWSIEGPEDNSDIIPVRITVAQGHFFFLNTYMIPTIGREKHLLGGSQPSRISRAVARAR
jgi:hypothetical protein